MLSPFEGTRHIKEALTRLTRLAQRKPIARRWLDRSLSGRLPQLAEPAVDVAVETGDPLGPALAERIREEASVELAKRIMALCLDETRTDSVALFEVLLESARKCLSAYRLRWQRPNQAQTLQLLEALGVERAALVNLGRPSEALAAGLQVVAGFRKLSGDHNLDLAIALMGLGGCYLSLGHRQEALEQAREALDLLQSLRGTDTAVERHLAYCLHNLGRIVGELGHFQEAIEVVSEAAKIKRRLVLESPGFFRSSLADSLNNLGVWLHEVGRLEEGIECLQEAIGWQRQLAAVRPDTYLPRLAMSLDNLAAQLESQDLWEEAVASSREAVLLYRELCSNRRNTFLLDLARSLGNLGVTLEGLGLLDEAADATEECIVYYEELASKFPDRFQSTLAGNLGNLANQLRETSRSQETEGYFKRAIRIQRALVDSEPENLTFVFDLSRSLTNLGLWLNRGQQLDGAIEASQEAVELRRRLQTFDSETFSRYLIFSLENLSDCYREAGLNRESERILQEVGRLQSQ